MMDRWQLGQYGEEYAAATLEKNGYTIVRRNFKCHGGEIDIIAKKGNTLAFVEVKTREAHSMVSGFEAIGPRKRAALVQAVRYYLWSFPQPDLQPRFDAVQITVRQDGTGCKVVGFDYRKGAFDVE